jgi:hypothetical protein
MNRWTRRLPWAVAAFFVIGSLVWLSRDSRIPREAFVDYSVYNTSPRGLSLAYGYLAASQRTVRPLARPVERAFLPHDGVLFRIRPQTPAGSFPRGNDQALHLRPIHAWDDKQPSKYPFSAEEEDWVRGGGRLVLALDHAYSSIVTRDLDGALPGKVFPAWPGVERLEPPKGRVLGPTPSGSGYAVFAAAGQPVLVRHPQGKGEILLCSVPELFQNGTIGRGDHLALLERLAGDGRPVYFDEYVHGIEGEAGMLEILRQWGFGPFLALILLAALGSFWRRRVRVGPEEDDSRETRVEAVDFVDALALLYRRMLPRRHALALYARAFGQAVSVQTGLRDAALEARVREYLPSRQPRPLKNKDLPVQDFQRELELINLAFRRLNDAKRPGIGRNNAAGARPA